MTETQLTLQMNDVFALTAYDWEVTEHYLYNMKEIPDKEQLDEIWKIAYAVAKSKIRSGIRTKPDSHEILIEMVNLLKENGIYPLKVWDFDVDNKKIREDDSLWMIKNG